MIEVTATTPGGTARESFAVTDSPLMGWDLTEAMVGPRVPLTVTGATFTTSYDGQVIEGLEIRDRITVLHSNVTIRDCRVRMTTPRADYHVHIPTGARGTLIEFCELWQDYPTLVPCSKVPSCNAMHGVGRGTTPPVYANGWTNGYWTLRRSMVRDVSRGPLMGSGCVVENNMIMAVQRSDHAYDDGSSEGVHRSALGASFGGVGCVVRGNRIVSRMPNCSSAQSIYTNGNVARDWLIEGNYYDGGSSTLHFGSSGNVTSGIVVRNNRWGNERYPSLNPGTPMGNRPAAAFNPANPGNEWHPSNTWLAALQPDDPAGHEAGETVMPGWVNV